MNDGYFTVVYKKPLSENMRREMMADGDWSAASHSHAIRERDHYSALCDKWNAECDAVREDNKRLASYAQSLDAKLECLIEAAQSVIDRWETPLWKDVQPTAEYIYRLRDVVNAVTAAAS